MLAKYADKVFKPMAPYQFQLELQTVERMDTLCTRAWHAARSGPVSARTLMVTLAGTAAVPVL